LDQAIGRLAGSLKDAFAPSQVTWLVASEYVIVPVQHVLFPTRVLRDANLLAVCPEEAGGSTEQLDLEHSRAWALVDHQFSHIFVRDARDIGQVVDTFRQQAGVSEVMAGDERRRYGLDHERAGEVIVVSRMDSWQAYYWWHDDARAPSYARRVDIHRKPGYDPIELHFDPAARCIPLDARLARGSHGAPATTAAQQGVLLSSRAGILGQAPLADTDVFHIVLRLFGI
jgi:hypothetical protein